MNPLSRAVMRVVYYPSLWFNRTMYSLRAWRPWDWVDTHVAVGGVPSRTDLRHLHQLGVKIIINMCREFGGHSRTLSELGMVQFRLPTDDFCCPCEEDLLRGIDFIQANIAAGRKVFIHCKAGRGRAPCMAICYLMASRGIPAEEAYGLIRIVRPQVASHLYDHPEVRSVERRLAERPFPAQDRRAYARRRSG